MDEWIRQFCDALDVPIADVDTDAVLDLARDAAHNVDRPAAPVTTYIVGYAAAQRGGGARLSVTPRSLAATLPGMERAGRRLSTSTDRLVPRSASVGPRERRGVGAPSGNRP